MNHDLQDPEPSLWQFCVEILQLVAEKIVFDIKLWYHSLNDEL